MVRGGRVEPNPTYLLGRAQEDTLISILYVLSLTHAELSWEGHLPRLDLLSYLGMHFKEL